MTPLPDSIGSIPWDEVLAYGVASPDGLVQSMRIRRRPVGCADVRVEILYCGICHSDLHHMRNDWKSSLYPMVPGHEILGRVLEVGSGVQNIMPGDLVGVGTFVNTCRTCTFCRTEQEPYCPKIVWTYDCRDADGALQFGGYSTHIVVASPYVIKLPAALCTATDALAGLAPLLCAGVTVYSPLRRIADPAGKHLVILGLGGLGHLGAKIGRALGFRVSVLSRKTDPAFPAYVVGEPVDAVLDTRSDDHDLEGSVWEALTVGATYILVGLPARRPRLDHFTVASKRICVTGSIVGSMRETASLFALAAENPDIRADVEIIRPDQLNDGLDRVARGEVRYRLVLDMQTENETLSA